MNPFDFVKSINSNNYIMEDSKESSYNPWLTNKAFSYHKDTILYANEINMHSNASKKMQYDYLFYSIKPAKRFSKWVKMEMEDIDAIATFYNLSKKEAKQALNFIPAETLEMVRKNIKN